MDKSIELQVERFKEGFPWMEIVASAVPGNGITIMDEQERRAAIEYASQAEVKGKCKFVPASGAATRMFRDIYSGLEKTNPEIERFRSEIKHFAFYDPVVFDGKDPAEVVLDPGGLNYGGKPKGLIPFHRYPDGTCRTPVAEQLVEAQEYLRNDDGTVRVTFTVSDKFLDDFRKEIDSFIPACEKRYGVKYDVRLTVQDSSTDTVAVDMDNRPITLEDGSLLRRPAGHGALIYNLNDIEEELVSIKNIDNVSYESSLGLISEYKLALMGICLELRDVIHSYIKDLDILSGVGIDKMKPYQTLPGYNALNYDFCATEECQELCNEIELFLRDRLFLTIPQVSNCTERVKMLRSKLNRPVRVCGMVKNEGEPGGGPFIVRDSDGGTSLQILESSQINPEDSHAVAELSSSTHFNPVDIVCCIRDFRGERFNLTDFVDPDAGLISVKSFNGRKIKALELPGLWNGSMGNWNTMFVEVPSETFNPVKEVTDLLKESHLR